MLFFVERVRIWRLSNIAAEAIPAVSLMTAVKHGIALAVREILHLVETAGIRAIQGVQGIKATQQ